MLYQFCPLKFNPSHCVHLNYCDQIFYWIASVVRLGRRNEKHFTDWFGQRVGSPTTHVICQVCANNRIKLFNAASNLKFRSKATGQKKGRRRKHIAPHSHRPLIFCFFAFFFACYVFHIFIHFFFFLVRYSVSDLTTVFIATAVLNYSDDFGILAPWHRGTLAASLVWCSISYTDNISAFFFWIFHFAMCALGCVRAKRIH